MGNKTLERINNKIIIDTKLLPREESEVLIDFIEFLLKRKRVEKRGIGPKIKFKEWPLNAKGKLSRREIYEEF